MAAGANDTPRGEFISQTMDFTCIETQIGNGDKLDCEVVDLDGSAGYVRVQLPRATSN